MSLKRIAIVGYGNVGKGVHRAVLTNEDMAVSGIITRDTKRTRKELVEKVKKVVSADSIHSIEALADETDVAILCGGSKKDLPEQGPIFAVHFNTVDSFDTHDKIPGFFEMMNGVASFHNHVSVISAGWDPGTYSINRILAESFLPGANAQAFYGLEPNGGLSMGHSDALRKIPGVKDARQYTHAIPEAMQRVRNGENPSLEPGEAHTRECFVVLEKDSAEERQRVESAAKKMDSYYEPYETTVDFVTKEGLNKIHKERGVAHDGVVIAASTTGEGNKASIEYKNTWKSNPEATGNILIACARAADRLRDRGEKGAYTMADIAPSDYSILSRRELLKHSM
jgi:diaminopimelate dehydrogenase